MTRPCNVSWCRFWCCCHFFESFKLDSTTHPLWSCCKFDWFVQMNYLAACSILYPGLFNPYGHLTLIRWSNNTTQVVETSDTNNSLSKDYPHPDNHAKQITDTHGFKLFTKHKKLNPSLTNKPAINKQFLYFKQTSDLAPLPLYAQFPACSSMTSFVPTRSHPSKVSADHLSGS